MFNITAAIGFLNFFDNIDVLLLTFVRVCGFFVVAPVFSSSSVPISLRAPLAVLTAYAVYSSGVVTPPDYDPATYEYVYIMVSEFLVGMVIGFTVYLVVSVLFFVGQIMDYQIGFSMVSVLDPLTQIQVPITGNMLYLVMTLIFMETGALNQLIVAFVDSFGRIPQGTGFIIGNVGLMNMFVDMLVDFFEIGVRIAMPMLGTVLVLDVALGLLVKAAPQMNIFVVGMPAKLLVGLVVLVIIVPSMSVVYHNLFNDSFRNVMNIINEMARPAGG
ncbi:MAG: flagellar biosynthetic protein FliR [Clostridiales bacterium]|jgi:flagellar biosynthetic protein FliR|nr:flagellar biosynthetic protein FliR [Clostridiales bacterium]